MTQLTRTQGAMNMTLYCPYCGFPGTEAEVDDHRAVAHRDEPQKGSNLPDRPRS